MNYFFNFLVNNFVLLCIVIVLSIVLLRNLNKHRRTSIYLLIILLITLLLPIFSALQEYVQAEPKSVVGATIFGALQYILKPLCILVFIFLSGQRFKGIWFYLLLVPLAVNIVTNIFPFIPATRTWSYFYYLNSTKGVVEWEPGSVPAFRYMPHIVSIIYLLILVIASLKLLQSKHITDAVGILVCAGVVALAAIIETFFNEDGSVVILPTSIAASTVFYYLFLYERSNKIDTLTGLFNRASYFDDLAKFRRDLTGIIQLDMNGLKYLNDNFGHLEGDKGLTRIAEAISNNTTRKMCAYRLGGDEFIVLAISESEQKIKQFISDFKEELKTTNYYCSIGYAYRTKECDSIDKMFKRSEERMYLDKAEFYKTANIERRKSAYITKE